MEVMYVIKKFLQLLLAAGSLLIVTGCSSKEDHTQVEIHLQSMEVYSFAENDAQVYHVNYPYYFYAVTLNKDGYMKSSMFDLNQPVGNTLLSQTEIQYFIDYTSSLPSSSGGRGNDMAYYVRLNYRDENGESTYLNRRGYDTFPDGWDEFIDRYNQILGGKYLTGSGKLQSVTPEFLTETFGVTDEDVRSGTLQDVIDVMELDMLECTGLFYITDALNGYYVSINEDAMEPYRPRELLSVESTWEEYDAFVEEYLNALGWDLSAETNSDQDGFRYFYDEATGLSFYTARTCDMDMLPVGHANTDDYYTMELDAHMEDMVITEDFYYNADHKFLIIPEIKDPDMILAFCELIYSK